MSKHQIKLNADVGEGFSNDEMLMPYLTYCNIACGGHVGDRQSIKKTILLAKKYKVRIGAHLSYPDKNNFGRIRPNISKTELQNHLKFQLQNIIEVADKENISVHHIKAHGALYHDIIDIPELWAVVIESINFYFSSSVIFLPAHVRKKWNPEINGKILYEGFADRQYNTDLKLLSRKKEGAILSSAEHIISQIIKMHESKKVFTADGSWKNIEVDTICLHGDHKGIEVYFPQVIHSLKERNFVCES